MPCASSFPERIGKLSLSEVSRLVARRSALCAISSQVRAESVGGRPELQLVRSAGAWLGPGLQEGFFPEPSMDAVPTSSGVPCPGEWKGWRGKCWTGKQSRK